ncbi:DUF4351 domain-containing protein [Gloeobacter violaceus]|uniref:Gsr1223 protein n=1 Tax=Gloeobacter violaceus (strain ATCC 29082 / PCC 7421) TaxID=251221 RepID=Q7NLA3_GLOVI|nr:DUF4351 domain-containing protein [Gloeobacter violaceus]BAC89164.1 gsr1223 [Gloeobacter violaceus PCC 7421]
MRESWVYQEIFDKGKLQGVRRIILRQLTQKLGKLPADFVQEIESITDSERLERLGLLGLQADDFDSLRAQI